MSLETLDKNFIILRHVKVHFYHSVKMKYAPDDVTITLKASESKYILKVNVLKFIKTDGVIISKLLKLENIINIKAPQNTIK